MAESLTMSLAPHLGKPEAQHLVQALCERVAKPDMTLHQVALAEPQVQAILSKKEIDYALDPGSYLGSTNTFIDRTLAAYHEIKSQRDEVHS